MHARVHPTILFASVPFQAAQQQSIPCTMSPVPYSGFLVARAEWKTRRLLLLRTTTTGWKRAAIARLLLLLFLTTALATTTVATGTTTKNVSGAAGQVANASASRTLMLMLLVVHLHTPTARIRRCASRGKRTALLLRKLHGGNERVRGRTGTRDHGAV